LEEANDDRESKLNRVKLAEKERDALEEPKLEAEEYIGGHIQILEKKSILFQIQRKDLKESACALMEKKRTT